jgi:hypothetical protein
MEKSAELAKTAGPKDVHVGGQDANRSVATKDLWKNALKKFQAENQITETELKELAVAGDLGDADTGAKKATELFKTSRHPPRKESDIMIAVSRCLSFVDTATGFVQEHVSGTVRIPISTCDNVLLSRI